MTIISSFSVSCAHSIGSEFRFRVHIKMGPVLEGAIVPEYIIKKEIFKSKLCADVTHEHREAFAFH